ncbi:MAG: sugar phosphate isomerase/epimerase [Clostridiaceae bacterium]|nr:sugar phosphate isomerase/epimerase [Clostridiales bacterium]MDD6876199.1 sugar phosphate isomerase/epimerase [Clostridiaceae bacterium]MDY3072737.1 sugar phosphate isomerase/epimerase family protein [Eubacteriales bacterium]MDY5016236.1 sugar phosphate isomerase/epimerase family protein [Eubacteriales bacterium]
MKVSVTTDEMARAYGDAEALKRLADIGFDAVDFGMFKYDMHGELFCGPQADFERYFESLGQTARDAGIEIGQVHSPMPSYTANPEEDAHILECQKKAILAAYRLGSPYIIIHPCIPQEYRYDHFRAETREINMKFYGELTPLLEQCGVRLGVENMFNWDPEKNCICPTVCSSAEEMIDYIDALGPQFVACLDTGHAQLSGSGAPDMARKLGARLKTLHVHDNDGISDCHVAPMLGYNGPTHMSSVCWTDFAAALREIGYTGTLSFETDQTQRMYGPALLMESTTLLYKVARELARMCEG